MLNRLSGFAPDLLAAIALPSDRHRLSIQNAFALLIIGLCSLAIAYLVQRVIGSALSAMVVFAFTASLLGSLQGSIVTGTGMDVRQFIASNHEWKPKPERLWLFLVMALIFSQPVLLAGFLALFPKQATQTSSDALKLRAEAAQLARSLSVGNLRGQIAVESEFLSRLGRSGKNDPNQLGVDFGDHSSLNRKALVIGNQSYPTSPLNNPKKDALDVQRALISMGFDTTVVIDGTEKDIALAVNKYVESLTAEDISFFYFSGHGFQSDGSNYLVPTDFTGRNRLQAIALNGVVASIASRRPVASIVVVDACRDFSYGGGGGLALTEAGTNTFLAFAAKPGQLAEDGPPNSNGKFTGALLQYIQQPIEVDAMFRQVRVGVANTTDNSQETWQAHNLKFPVVLPALQIARNGKKPGGNRFDPSKFSSYTGVSSCMARSSGMREKDAETFLGLCVKGRILRMQDDIKEMQEDGVETLVSKVFVEVPRASAVAISYRTMWRDGLYALLATVLATFVLVLPFLWREVQGKMLHAYERFKLDANRDEISKAYAAASVSIREMNISRLDMLAFLPSLNFEPVFGVLDPREDLSVVDRTRKGFDEIYGTLKGQETEVRS